MKIISKIKIHPFFYVVFLITIMTGHFKEYILITGMMLFHECGHVILGIFFKWEIEKIIILPYGSYTIFNNILNKSFISSFLVAITGLIFQTIFFLIFRNNIIIVNAYYVLLLFNLLPIYPLDGANILNILLNVFLPFKISHKISIYISLIMIMLLFFLFRFNLVLMSILFFLIYKNISELKNHYLVFEKFLYERYYYKTKHKSYKVTTNLESLYKNYDNIFNNGNIHYTEKQMINKKTGFN